MLAVAPGETRRAQTREGVDAVHTGAAVEAGAAEKNKNKCCMKFSEIKVFCSFLGRSKSIELSLPELQAHLICPQKVKNKCIFSNNTLLITQTFSFSHQGASLMVLRETSLGILQQKKKLIYGKLLNLLCVAEL